MDYGQDPGLKRKLDGVVMLDCEYHTGTVLKMFSDLQLGFIGTHSEKKESGLSVLPHKQKQRSIKPFDDVSSQVETTNKKATPMLQELTSQTGGDVEWNEGSYR